MSAFTSIAHLSPLFLMAVSATLVPNVAFGQTSEPAPATAASSPAPTAGTPEPQIRNDRRNYAGDKIYPRFPGTFQLATFENGVLTVRGVACIVKDAKLQGKGEQTKDGKIYYLFEVDENEVDPKKSDSAKAKCSSSSGPVRLAVRGEMLAIPGETLDVFPFNRRGIAFGTLVVPFKYHLRGDKSFSNESSIGGYLGYRWDGTASSGASVQLALFGGATSIKLSQTVDGKTVEQSLTGFTYGVGLLGEFKRDFQIGLVLGADRVGKSSNYSNNGKPWIALSLGFDFAR